LLILLLEGYLPNLEGNVHIPHFHIFNFLFTKKSLLIYIYIYIYKIALHSLGEERQERFTPWGVSLQGPTNKWVSHEKERRYIFSAFWGYLNHLTLNNNLFIFWTFHGNMNMNIQEGKLEYSGVANCTRRIGLLILFVCGPKFFWKHLNPFEGRPFFLCVYLCALPQGQFCH